MLARNIRPQEPQGPPPVSLFEWLCFFGYTVITLINAVIALSTLLLSAVVAVITGGVTLGGVFIFILLVVLIFGG